MAIQSVAIVAVIATLATHVASDTLLWSGDNTNFDNGAGWSDASPFASSGLPLPQYVTLVDTVTTLKAGMTADVGLKLVLQGNSVLQLGSGAAGSSATIRFNTGDAASRSKVGIFQPVPATNNGNTPSAADAYDWNCNLNWRTVVSGSDTSSIPLTPPCYQDIAQFKNDGNTYGASTYGATAGAASIGIQGGSSTVSACPSTGSKVSISPRVTVDLVSCTTTFQFPSTVTPSSAKDCANTCSTYTTVNGISGAQYHLYTAGAYAGNAYTVVMDSSGNPTSLTYTGSSAVTISGSAGSPGATYTLDGVKVSASGSIISTSTSTPATTVKPTPGQSSSNDSSSGGSLLIIAIAIVAVVVIIAIAAFVHIKKRGQGSDGAAPREGAVSFENPMYDGEKSVGGADAGNADGLYSDPVIGGAYSDLPAGGGGGASGYMDVPAGQDGAGYLDVNDDGGFDDEDDEEDGGVSGYMDVAPGGDDNDDV